MHYGEIKLIIFESSHGLQLLAYALYKKFVAIMLIY